jgi:Ca-activated chloride channel family protein
MIYNSFGIRISLLFVVLLGVTYFFNLKQKFTLPKKYFNQNSYVLSRVVNIVLILSILLLPLDLQFITNKKIITQKILPVQIVFDISLSMAADDISPSRYDAAKKALLKLIQKLDGYNISLIAFSGIPFIYIPFSTDTHAVMSKLQDTNLGDFPPTEDFIGTAIGDALLLGIKNLDKVRLQDPEYPGVIILITDGDSNK